MCLMVVVLIRSRFLTVPVRCVGVGGQEVSGSVMKSLLLLLSVLSLRTHGARSSYGSSPDRVPVLDLHLDLSSLLHRLDPRFLSVTIDASLAAEERSMLLLRAKQLREEGGDPGGRRSAGPGLHPAQEDDVRVQPVPGRRTVWAGRGSAAGPPGRHPGGVRTSTTGMQRWNLTKSVLKVLFAAFTDFWENGTVVVERRQWLCPPESFLQSGGGAIDACTWHHYYVDGRAASLEDFLDPTVLDSLAVKTGEVLETVKRASPGTPVWLGETSSAFGGGAAGLSDSFVAGFMWLDKLGLAARMGLDVVMRQVLVGAGSYHLLDDDLNPLPDYWLSVLHKRLVGPEVLNVDAVSGAGGGRRVRSYLHCANRRSYRDGAVVLMSMNLSPRPVRMQVPVPVSNSTVETFVLQSDRPGMDGLRSRSVKLNGVLLEMVDDETLPLLAGVPLPPSDHLQLPAFSLAFFVFTDAGAAACR
ncbi:heparanase isoform X3 [Oryzias latipes]